jgi:hypothetical protein
MDWVPTRATLQPQLKQLRYRSTEPTPFHGALPAISAGGGNRTVGQAQQAKQAIGLPPGFFDKSAKSALPARQATSASEAMAQPTFFGHDRQTDTGLENIFEKVFHVKDETSNDNHMHAPAATTEDERTNGVKRSAPTKNVSVPLSHTSFLQIFSAFSFFSLLIILALWIVETTLKPGGSMFGYYVTLASSIIPITHLASHLVQRKHAGKYLQLFGFALEAFLLIGVAQVRDQFGDLLRDLWNKLAIATLALLLPQEFVFMNASSTDLSTARLAEAVEIHEDLRAKRQPHVPPESRIPEREPLQTGNAPATPGRRIPARSDSADSIESRTSVSTTSTFNDWHTPGAARFEAPASIPSSRSRTSGLASSGFGALSLSEGGASSRGHQGFGASHWEGNSSTGSSIAGPRLKKRP